MIHQVGTTLQTDDRGIARRGIIVRHLVLPGFVQNSIGVLKLISEELSPNLHISLMSQYYPPSQVISSPEPELVPQHPRVKRGGEPSQFSGRAGDMPTSAGKSQIANRKSLLRSITLPEYETVLDAFNSLGFSRGWIQDFDSHLSYRPDFTKKDPFAER